MEKKKVVFGSLPTVRLSGYVPTAKVGRDQKAVYITLDTAQMVVPRGVVIEVERKESGEEATEEELAEALRSIFDLMTDLMMSEMDKLCGKVQEKVNRNKVSPFGGGRSSTAMTL